MFCKGCLQQRIRLRQKFEHVFPSSSFDRIRTIFKRLLPYNLFTLIWLVLTIVVQTVRLDTSRIGIDVFELLDPRLQSGTPLRHRSMLIRSVTTSMTSYHDDVTSLFQIMKHVWCRRRWIIATRLFGTEQLNWHDHVTLKTTSFFTR